MNVKKIIFIGMAGVVVLFTAFNVLHHMTTAAEVKKQMESREREMHHVQQVENAIRDATRSSMPTNFNFPR